MMRYNLHPHIPYVAQHVAQHVTEHVAQHVAQCKENPLGKGGGNRKRDKTGCGSDISKSRDMDIWSAS